MRRVMATVVVWTMCLGMAWATPPPRPGAQGQADDGKGRPAPTVEMKTAAQARQGGRSTTIEHGSFSGPPYALVDSNAVQYYQDEAVEIGAGGYLSDYEYKTLEATLISFDGTYATDRGGCIYIQTVVTGLQSGDIVEVDNNYLYDDGTGYYSYWDQAPYWVLIGSYTHNPTQTINNWLIYFYDAGAGSYTMVIGSGEYDLASNTDDLTLIIGDRFRLTRSVKVWTGATLSNPQTSSRGYTYSTTGISGGALANSADLDQTDMMYVGVAEAWVDDDWAGHSNGDIVAGHVFGQDAFETIQRAIDGVSTGATIHVAPGTYDQDEANGRDPVNGGPGPNDFNIFVDKSITIRGEDAGGAPIADPALVAAHIVPKRLLPTFGSSAVYVQADDVTLQGLEINAYVADENCKTLEIIGNDIVVRHCALNALDTTSCAYLDDPRFDADTGTSHVQAYTFDDNIFDGGGIWPGGIRITSGAGWSGPLANRVISSNTFVDTCDAIQFVGPGAESWDVYPVGAATITGNSFAGSDRRHVIAWGEYAGAQGYAEPDWAGILATNTLDKGAVTWITPDSAIRKWDLAPFKYVAGIYSAIQRYAVNKAQAGDTVQVLAGEYAENITVSASLHLIGAGPTTIVYPAISDIGLPNPDAGPSFRGSQVIVVEADNVEIANLVVDGDNPDPNLPADIDARNGIIENYTIGVWDNLVVHDCTIQNIYLRGLYASSGGDGFHFYNNTVTNVAGGPSSIAIFNFGGAGIIEDNTVTLANDAIAANWSRGTQFLNNTVTASGSGVHTDNNGGFGGAADLIQGNEVSDSAANGYGVWVFFPYVNTMLNNNSITNADVGLFAWGGSGGVGQFTNNTVDGMDRADCIGLYVTTGVSTPYPWPYIEDVAATFAGNAVANCAYSVYLEEEPTYTTSVVLHDNSFAGITSTVAAIVDASGNWWGDNSPAGVAAAIDGNVDYTPWLDSGTDTGPSTPGFQGDFATLWVDDDSPQGGGGGGRIAEALGLVTGSIINVAAGTYAERLTLSAGVELRGAQYGVDPTPPGARTDPAAESVIDISALPVSNPNVAVEIPAGVTNVAVSGFTLIGSPTLHYADESVVRAWDDHITIADNIVNGYYGILYKGNDYFTAERNRVVANKVGFTLQPLAATHVTVADNAFVPGTAPASDAAAIYLANVNTALVSGNSASGFANGNGVGGSNLSNLQLLDNDFAGNKKGVSIWGSSTFVTISGNTISGCAVAGIDIKGDDLTITGNQILGNPTGIIIDKHTLNTERVAINNNDILNNGIGLDVKPTVLMMVDATNNNWGFGEGPLDATGTYEVSAADCGTDPAAALNVAPASALGNAVSGNVDYCPWLSDALLTLRPQGGGTCYNPGDALVVEVYLSDVATTNNIVGGDFFLAYDQAKLDFVGADPGDSPFLYQVYESSNETLGTIDYGVGVVFGGDGTKADTVMARLTFTVLAGTNDCDVADLVTFRPHDPPTKLSDYYANPVYPGTIELEPLGIDSAAPGIAGTVDGGSLNATCGATVPVNVVVTDNCSVLAADVTFSLATTSGTLDPNGVTVVQTNSTTVTISGSAILTGVTACSATVSINVDAYDCPENHGTFATSGTWSDATAPTFVGFPGDREQNADPNLDTAVLVPAIIPPTGVDNCDSGVQIDYQRSDRANWNEGLTDPYPVGTTTITWRATDNCTNQFAQDQTVTIAGVYDVVITLDIDSLLAAEVDRCITFEVWECGTPKVSVPTVVHFTPLVQVPPLPSYASGSTTIQIPYNHTYTCITARDKLHALRRTVELGTAGSPPHYTATFAYNADPAVSKLLLSGNLNDDGWIDILDFGVFSWQFMKPSTANTTCSTAYPHADLTGDGAVNAGDFSPIFTNYLKGRDADCCSSFRGDDSQPITRISVADLIAQGLGELAAGDINGDGWLDEQDLAEFAAGLPPAPVIGDLNCDGAINFADINPFVMALSNPAAWQQAYPDCNLLNADVNGDGNVDFADINAFIALLGG